jgi:hypothetical protein
MTSLARRAQAKLEAGMAAAHRCEVRVPKVVAPCGADKAGSGVKGDLPDIAHRFG